MTDQDRQTDRFDAALREWARGAPRTPARVAARRVSARIGTAGHRGTRTTAWVPRLAAACGLALAVASGALLWRSGTPAPAPTPAVDAPPVLPENVVVFWLDANTPVYFVVGPPGDPAGGTP
jgi:hypothetical protein